MCHNLIINHEDNNQDVKVGHRQTKCLSNETNRHCLVVTFNTDIVFIYKHLFKEGMSVLNDVSEKVN